MKKSVMIVISIILIFISCTFEKEQGSNTKTGNFPISEFEGKIMFSKDNGLSWNKVQHSLPEHINIQAVGFDKENVIIAVNKDSIFTGNKDLNETWKQISVDELSINKSNNNTMIGTIWSGKKYNYLEVIFGELYKKEITSSQWIPVRKPKDVIGIVQLAEDEKGNVFVATGYGLYLSQDGCINWTQIVNGRVDDVEILHGEIFVSSLRGILSSKDLGKSWSTHSTPQIGFTLNDQQISPFYSLSVHGDELIAVKNQGIQNLSNEAKVITYSSSNGLWKIHEVNKQFKNLENLTAFAKINNSIYYSFGGGLMVSEDNGGTWNKILNYTPKSQNKALKVSVIDGKLYCYEVSAGC